MYTTVNLLICCLVIIKLQCVRKWPITDHYCALYMCTPCKIISANTQDCERNKDSCEQCISSEIAVRIEILAYMRNNTLESLMLLTLIPHPIKYWHSVNCCENL